MWHYSTCIRFKQDGKYGLKSPSGEILVKPEYDAIFGIRSEIVFVTKQNGRYGLLSIKTGVIHVPCYDDVHGCRTAEVLFVYVAALQRWGIIDYFGNVVLEPELYIRDGKFPELYFVGFDKKLGKVYRCNAFTVAGGKMKPNRRPRPGRSGRTGIIKDRGYSNPRWRGRRGNSGNSKSISGRTDGDPSDRYRQYWDANNRRH